MKRTKLTVKSRQSVIVEGEIERLKDSYERLIIFFILGKLPKNNN